MPQDHAMAFKTTDICPPSLIGVFQAAVQAIQRRHMPGPARITLVLNGMSKPSANSRRLAGRKSPLGEIVSDGDGNTQLVAFECMDLLAWMTANGFLSASNATLPVA